MDCPYCQSSESIKHGMRESGRQSLRPVHEDRVVVAIAQGNLDFEPPAPRPIHWKRVEGALDTQKSSDRFSRLGAGHPAYVSWE